MNKKNTVPYSIVWVDIPVKNIQRAVEFYSFILNTKIQITTMSGITFAPFPHEDNQPSGCLVEQKDISANANSLLVYFGVEGRLDSVLKEVEQRGGKIIKNKEQIGPWGYRAIILDSEQNRIALHSM
jgi:uncharacterized protein